MNQRLIQTVFALFAIMALQAVSNGSSVALADPAPQGSESISARGEHETSFPSLQDRASGTQFNLTHSSVEKRGGNSGDAWMRLQRQLNNGRARLAQATKREVPSAEELDAALDHRKRWLQRRALGSDGFSPDLLGRAVAHSNDLEGTVLDLQTTSASHSDRPRGSRRGSGKFVVRDNSDAVNAIKDAAQQNKVTDAQDPSGSHSIGLSIEANDVGYFADVQIGSSNNKFKLLVDSGSSDTWVTGSDCNNCGSHNKLGNSDSKSLKISDKEYKISYGTGYVQVKKATDSMNVAGINIKNMNIGVSTSESPEFGGKNIPFDGLMGLGGSSLSILHSKTVIDTMSEQNLVDQPVAGYRLGRVADGSDNNHGQITFGAIDSSQVSGSVQEFDNQSDNGYWIVELDDVSVGSKSVLGSRRRRGNNKHHATLDTGTSLIIAPKSIADSIHNAIQGASSDGQGGYEIPCSTDVKLSFTFSGGHKYTMDSRDMIFSPSDNSDKCVSAVSSGSSEGDSAWILGAAFLKNVYFATNTKSNQIGIGKLK